MEYFNTKFIGRRCFTQYEEQERVWSSSRMRLVSLVLEYLGPVIGFK